MDGGVKIFSLTMPDRIVVTVIAEKNYADDTAWRFLSLCYIGFRDQVPDPQSKYDRMDKEQNMVKEIYPEMEDLFYKFADYRNATESHQIAAVLSKVIEISGENRKKLE